MRWLTQLKQLTQAVVVQASQTPSKPQPLTPSAIEPVLAAARKLKGRQAILLVGADRTTHEPVTIIIRNFTDKYREFGRSDRHRYHIAWRTSRDAAQEAWLSLPEARKLLAKYARPSYRFPHRHTGPQVAPNPSGPARTFPRTLVELVPDAERRQELLDIVRAFAAAGHTVYIVGGALRDYMLGHMPKDLDLATTATPEEMLAVAEGKFRVSTEQGGAYAGVLGINGYDFASLREEADYSERKRPAYRFTRDIRIDQQRRDFTINGGAAEILPDGSLRLIDSVGFMDDIIRNRVVRCIRDPELRFREDPIRLLRAVTISASTGLAIEPETAQCAKELAHLLQKVPSEQIGRELVKMIERRVLHKGLPLLRDFGFLPYVLPELAHQVGMSQNPAYHHLDVFEHTVAVVRTAEEQNMPLAVRLAALFHDSAKGLPGIRGQNRAGQPSDLRHEEAGTPLAFDGVMRLQLGRSLAERVALLVKFHGIRPAASAKSVIKTLNRMRHMPLPEEIAAEIQELEQNAGLPPRTRQLLIRAARWQWNFGSRAALADFVHELFLLMRADASGFAPHFRQEMEAAITGWEPIFAWVLEHIPFYTNDLPGITAIPQQEGLKGPAIRRRLLELIKEEQDRRKAQWHG